MNYHSVFVVAVITLLEGDRDYDEQTLASPMFQILSFLRGVVNIVLVSFKKRKVRKYSLFAKDRKVVYTYTRSLFAHNPKTKILYFIGCDGLDRIPEK